MIPRLYPAALALLLAAALRADVVPSPLFQDHAVLQRDKPVPVWGSASPGEAVTITFAGQSVSTVADASGRWRADLAPLPASATPADLVIRGNNTITLRDVLVGEVWLASGQSNMEWPVKDTHDADLERATARHPLIREIKVKRSALDAPSATFEGAWRVASPDTVPAFSAVAYAYARELHFALGVPVGIVNSSWGGTPVEAWMSPAALASDPAFAVVGERWDQVLADYPAKKSAYDAELAAWREARAAAEARGESFTAAQPRGPMGPGSSHAPATLHHGMIHPLLPYALRGAIWYQGETNAGRASEYHALFSAMIRDWRAGFAQGDFPFFWVQLAAYRASGGDNTEWAFLREAQDRTLALPATGQAVILDSAVSDHSDIHPRAKLPVGRRLARLALNRAYGLPGIADSGPRFAAISPVPATDSTPASLRITFQPEDRRVRHPARVLAGFEIAGEDRVFHPAEARIEGGRAILVSSPAVPAPVAVRYGWKNSPDAALQDDLGLPVPPFRSDNW